MAGLIWGALVVLFVLWGLWFAIHNVARVRPSVLRGGNSVTTTDAPLPWHACSQSTSAQWSSQNGQEPRGVLPGLCACCLSAFFTMVSP